MDKIATMEELLKPFAKAYARLKHFDEPEFPMASEEAVLIAEDERNGAFELMALSTETNDEEEVTLTVGHLKAAHDFFTAGEQAADIGG